MDSENIYRIHRQKKARAGEAGIGRDDMKLKMIFSRKGAISTIAFQWQQRYREYELFAASKMLQLKYERWICYFVWQLIRRDSDAIDNSPLRFGILGNAPKMTVTDMRG